MERQERVDMHDTSMEKKSREGTDDHAEPARLGLSLEHTILC